MRHVPLLLLGLLAAGPARDQVPAATPAGEPVDCLSIPQIRESRVRNDQVIDFYTAGRRVYRVTLPQSCPELGFERAFSYQTSLSQLCSTDIITVFRTSPISRGASCGMGRFQPVTLAGKEGRR